MGYLHIDNLEKSQAVLQFKELYVLEKCHGTSAHIKWDFATSKLTFFAGGGSHLPFVALFNQDKLIEGFTSLGQNCIVYGESYGGKQQGMSHTYGVEGKFIVFDVAMGERETWLDVPNACQVAEERLGLEFVPYHKIATSLEILEFWRDRPSEIAVRRGIAEPKTREGIVIRPIFECNKSNGQRVIAKFKGAAFNERATTQKIGDPEKLKMVADAEAIAQEWVTGNRLKNVLSHIPEPYDIKMTGTVIRAMVEDVAREANGEIVFSSEAQRAVGKATAVLYKTYLDSLLKEGLS